LHRLDIGLLSFAFFHQWQTNWGDINIVNETYDHRYRQEQACDASK